MSGSCLIWLPYFPRYSKNKTQQLSQFGGKWPKPLEQVYFITDFHLLFTTCKKMQLTTLRFRALISAKESHVSRFEATKHHWAIIGFKNYGQHTQGSVTKRKNCLPYTILCI
ncbi:unnamed protein product [Blepharisma stoltei]|uniref:Uncharacterized protein n=1 Tax=Blepharisma stoltei TaxID=1481888 RepID=A0AAU9K3L4_9CILI|nr:unnamed protein product [Blepharisma stoltei]